MNSLRVLKSTANTTKQRCIWVYTIVVENMNIAATKVDTGSAQTQHYDAQSKYKTVCTML